MIFYSHIIGTFGGCNGMIRDRRFKPVICPGDHRKTTLQNTSCIRKEQRCHIYIDIILMNIMNQI